MHYDVTSLLPRGLQGRTGPLRLQPGILNLIVNLDIRVSLSYGLHYEKSYYSRMTGRGDSRVKVSQQDGWKMGPPLGVPLSFTDGWPSLLTAMISRLCFADWGEREMTGRTGKPIAVLTFVLWSLFPATTIAADESDPISLDTELA